jgi:TPR repeat protein
LTTTIYCTITLEQLRAADQAAKDKKNQAAAKALKYNQELAAAGDVYGQVRMGERYRDGDGVPKDIGLARDWFSKAAAQGDKNAALELQKLPQNDPFKSPPH